MKKTIKVLLTLMLIASITLSSDLYAPKADWTIRTTKTDVKSTKFVKNEYSDWYRLNKPYYAYSSGEKSMYSESKTVKTTSSIESGISLKQLSLKLGYSVERSVSNTYRSTGCRKLKKKESAAFYYRLHYKVYDVKVEVTEYKNGKASRSYCKTKRIKVAVSASPKDYGWFYTKGKTSKLKKELPKSYQPGNI